jgi:hypothetical protein
MTSFSHGAMVLMPRESSWLGPALGSFFHYHFSVNAMAA